MTEKTKKRMYRIENHCTPRSTAPFKVTCKCPADGCGKIHVVPMRSKPIIMPRIFCRAHDHLRYDDGEGSGYMTTKKASRGARS